MFSLVDCQTPKIIKLVVEKCIFSDENEEILTLNELLLEAVEEISSGDADKIVQCALL